MQAIGLTFVDWLVIAIYFGFVLGIGFYLRGFTKTEEDFFLAGRKNSAWVAGLAFLSANLGALELLGMTGNTFKYGMYVAHFYWIGAIPAMLFLGIYMMPFYYSRGSSPSRATSSSVSTRRRASSTASRSAS